MRKFFLTLSIAALLCGQAGALSRRQQTAGGRETPKPSGAQGAKPQAAPQQPQRTPPSRNLDLDDFGIRIEPDARLVVMMAALDAAGWDPTPKGETPYVFREQVRRDQAALDPALRSRMQDFYRRNALKDERATPAEQAARYVSLAYTLGQPPTFEAPPRSDDLPSGVLDVLDFTPLLREFYQKSGMAARLPSYLQTYRAAGDRLRAPSADMARAVLSYFNTRPQTIVAEYTREGDPAAKSDKKKDEKKVTVIREKERLFRIVPDLLGAPGAINFRIIGDDYFALAPAGVDPRASELRRAYVQYAVDPLVVRFNRDVAAKRAEIKLLLDRERERQGRDITPDVFLTVARSLVAAADARLDEIIRLRVLQAEVAERLRGAKDQAARDAAAKESKERQAFIADAAVSQLAEAYERGAVLAFHFAEKLRGLEDSGFDIANFIPDLISTISAERELRRPAEYAAAVERAREARKRAHEAREREANAEGPRDERRAALVRDLGGVEELLRLKNYEEAETRLLALRAEYRDEPRIYFALGQAASLAAQEAFDETLQAQRLTNALQHYRQALLFATPDADRTLILRAHLASGRILAHLERKEEALKEFDAVIGLSDAGDRLHQEALAEKRKLTAQP